MVRERGASRCPTGGEEQEDNSATTEATRDKSEGHGTCAHTEDVGVPRGEERKAAAREELRADIPTVYPGS